MIVQFYVIQENEKKERNNLFLGTKEVIFLTNGEHHNFNESTFVVVEQEIFEKSVYAYCHQCKNYIKDAITPDETIGYSERE